MNADDFTYLADAQNLLYLINPGSFNSRKDFVAAVAATNYDLVLIEAFFGGDEMLTAQDV